jgi:hypothetical protein
MREFLNKINITGDNIQGNDTITAGEFNSIAKELNNVLASADITAGDVNVAGEDVINNQLATAIFNIAQKSIWWIDNSTQENQIILTRGDSIVYPALPFAGQKISWVNSIENTSSTTIKVGLYNAIPLKTSSGQDLTIQTLSNNILYNAIYDGSFWRLEGVSSIILTGMIYMGEDQGNSLECNGAEISRITYARLFAKIGTIYGVGDGSTTFNLPNYSNRVARGIGSLIALGESQEDAYKLHSHTINDIAGSFGGGGATGSDASFTLAGSFGVGGFNVVQGRMRPYFLNTAFETKELEGVYTFSSHRAGVTKTNDSGGTETRVKALGTQFWIFI